jgi:hypothetical protein
MNTTPNALAPHSGGPILPYVIVGFGDDSWGLMDGRTGQYSTVLGGPLRLFSKASSAEEAASRYLAGGSKAAFPFGPLLHEDGKPRVRSIL